MLAFGASYALQRHERRTLARSHIFLELLPALRDRVNSYHQVADQTRDNRAVYRLKNGEWAHPSDLDPIYRHAVLAGGKDVAHVNRIREPWSALCRELDEEMGISATDMIVGNPEAIGASWAALTAIDQYSVWIETKNLRSHPWDKHPPMVEP